MQAIQEKIRRAEAAQAQAGANNSSAAANFNDQDDDNMEDDDDDAGYSAGDGNGRYATFARTPTVHDLAALDDASDGSAPGNGTAPGPLSCATRARTRLEPLHTVRNPFMAALPPLRHDLRGDPRLVRPAPPDIGNGEAERLLEGLIAECHFLMRELVLPSAMQSIDADERRRFLSSAMELAQTGATVAKTVAKLRRGAPAAGMRHSRMEEHIQIES